MCTFECSKCCSLLTCSACSNCSLTSTSDTTNLPDTRILLARIETTTPISDSSDLLESHSTRWHRSFTVVHQRARSATLLILLHGRALYVKFANYIVPGVALIVDFAKSAKLDRPDTSYAANWKTGAQPEPREKNKSLQARAFSPPRRCRIEEARCSSFPGLSIWHGSLLIGIVEHAERVHALHIPNYNCRRSYASLYFVRTAACSLISD